MGQFNNIGGAGSLLAEVTRDRFVGYPRISGWEDDIYVPFMDMDTGRNIYPIDAVDLPLDWQIEGNVNEENFQEHIPDRPPGWYANQNVDTVNAVFHVQGTCDPSERNKSSPVYYPVCTAQNNNVQLGGKIKPTKTGGPIYNKAKDLSWLLKPLYETHNDVKTVGIFFANSGAGANIQYPSTVLNGTDTFESIGCDWMNTIHPRTGNRIGTTTDRLNCHGAKEIVTMREVSQNMCREWRC